MAATFNFEALCEDLQAEICACVASSRDGVAIQRLHLVSKTIRRLCEEPYVLRRVAVKQPLFPWYDAPESVVKYNEFVQRCIDAGNPEAMYRYGLVQYFHYCSDKEQQEKGLQHIVHAAEKGVEEAIQLYGVIQLCLGTEDKQKVYQRLRPFLIPLVESKVLELEERWDSLRSSLNWIGGEKMRELKARYVRDDCKCDGLTSRWFSKNWPGWSRFERFQGMVTSMACEKCLWHEVIQYFFDYLN